MLDLYAYFTASRDYYNLRQFLLQFAYYNLHKILLQFTLLLQFTSKLLQFAASITIYLFITIYIVTKRYQDVLQDAQSEVDYVYAPRLYMSPSNMELEICQVIGYNNKIVIASDQQKTGINSDINTESITQTNTGETGIGKPQISTDAPTNAQPQVAQTPHVSQPQQPQVSPHIAAKNQQHIDEKTQRL